MSTTAPNPGQPWQPAPQQPAPAYGQPAPQYAPQPPYVPQPPAANTGPAAQPKPSNRSILHRWPTWAQNTALAIGAVAVLVVVFFAGYFAANAIDGGRTGFGTGQNFTPRQFGGNGNGFGGQSGSGNGFGGQSGNGSGSQSGSGNGS